ncbi:glucose/arabinose dehydrogenase [Gordonia amarae]|nr:glucose/arabinose dehydrogenase [Gordonia amarae]
MQMPTARRARMPGVLLALALLTACGTSDGPASTSTTAVSTPVGDAPRTVVDGLDAPWSVAFHEGVALISERDTGRILELGADGRTREVTTVAGVEASGEGGLLGIAVHDGYLYAYYTAADENRVERFRIGGAPGGFTLARVEAILAGIPSAWNHNGGRIAFGPDGMLYVTTGDAGRRDDAQDRNSVAGKILRMTPEGKAPQDNPFPGSLVYSYGHRNPQGLAWAGDGTMYAAEFGQDTWDELNIIEPGKNYGWPQVEGIAGRSGFVDPVQQWDPDDASPSGIAIVGDTLFIANLRGERLRVVSTAHPDTAEERFTREFGRLRDVARAPDGSLWILTNNTDGRGRPADGDDRILRLRVGN